MLTIQEAARKAGVSEKTIRRAIRRRKLKVVVHGYRTKRIRDTDLEAYFNRITI